MDILYQDFLEHAFGIDESIIRLTKSVEHEIRDIVSDIESVREINQYKVIAAMQEHRLSDSHFGGTTGYGYNDRGREVLESVYAYVFGAEDALVRHHIVSGTQAIAICLYGNLRPGDELLSITGKPYDTLEEVIGIRGDGAGSLKDFGIVYRQIDLLDDGGIDTDNISTVMGPRTKMVLIQRSRGYDWRPSISIGDIRKAVEAVKRVNRNAIVMVDNCYGEFTETEEPTQAGADLVAGSLIKNPGGGLVPAGGYVAGKRELVQNAAFRLTTPGLGREVGATLGNNRLMFQGLFMAPHAVAESLRGAAFAAALMRKLGFETSPGPADKRSDIIQAIRFNDPDSMIAFCQGIQKGSPVDSFVTPEPWDMPGYDSKVIMAAGAFIQGSSIELSADAPLKPPYIAYMQGGLVYEHVKLGVMTALKYMKERNLTRF
jgi:cystathionine beta-lyase family protein involved in aluminum resistance